MTNYNSIFGSSSQRIGATFQDDEEEKKKKQATTPSKKAGVEQKTVTSQSSYDRIFGGASQRFETSQPKVLKTQEPDEGFSVIEESAKKDIQMEGEQKQPGLFERITKKTGEILKGAKDALFGGPQEKTEVGKPVEVQLSDDEWAQNVGRAVEVRVDMQSQLEEAKIDLDNFYREEIKNGNTPLQYSLRKDKEGHYLPESNTPGVGVSMVPNSKFKEHYDKVKRIQALQSGITEIDRFVGDAPARQGILKTVWGKIKNEGGETLIPFARGNYEKWLYSGEREAILKYQAGEELTKEEQVFLNTFRARVYTNYAEKGVPEQAGEVIADIPRYAVEIYATAGLVNPITTKLAGAATIKAGPKVIQTLAPKLINNSVKMAAASNLNIPGISGKMAEYMLPTFNYEQELKGDVLDQLSPGDAPMEAGKKAYLTNLVEYVSEGVGGYIDDAAPFVKKAFVSKWLANRQVIDKAPGIITKTLRTANFNSLVGEVLEEEIGEPFQAAIEKRDYNDPLFTPEGRERLLVEVLGIGVFSGSAAVADKTIAKIVERRKRTGDKIDIVPTTEKEPEAPATAQKEFEEKAGLQPQVPPTTPQGPGEQKEEPVKREVTPEPLGRLTTVFRGAKDQTVDTEIQNGITGGVSTSLDENVAKQFAERAGGTVKKYTISPDAKVVNHSDLEAAVVDIPAIKDKTAAIKQIIKDQGIDVVRFDVPEGAKGESELRVVNARVLKEVTEKEEPKARVTPTEVKEAKGEPRKPVKEKEFFVMKYGDKGEAPRFEGVKGEPVNVGGGLDTFIHKATTGEGYTVSEGRTGLSIAQASTKSAAVTKARELVAKNIGTVNDLINRKVKETGESPRYLEEVGSGAIINQDEKQTNQNLGGNDRPRQPADTIPASQEQPEGAGEAAQEPSGEVARGERPGSDTGAGERFATRLSDTFTDIPEEVQQEAEEDWLDNYAEEYGDLEHEFRGLQDELKALGTSKKNAPERVKLNAKIADITERQVEIEEAFVNKWRKKVIEYVEPAVESKVDQAALNKEIEELVREKGFDGYSPEEKAKLKLYAGAGGLERVGAEGRGLLDEYYTPEPIVDFMWEKVRELQPTTQNVIEPSVGIGRFLSGAPEGATIRGAEINNISYIIAKVLHPKAFLVNKPFEDYFVDPRGNEKEFEATADLVIGNPPYGEHRGKYLGLGEEPKLIKYEDYFMKRGLNLLEDDGLLAYVIPSTFIRSGNYYAKQAISVLGFLEDAYRLPEGVFGTTSIGTDIIFIRKSPTTDEAEIERRIDDFSNNIWFANNPDKVLGEVSLGTGRYGGDQVIGSLEDAMRRARVRPAEIEDTLSTEDREENAREEQKEVEEAEADTKKEEAPPVNRVPEAPKVTNELNKKAQIIPAKKDTLLQLSQIEQEDMRLWQSVTVTGELDSRYTAAYDPKNFYNTKIAVVIEGGVPKYYPNILYYQGDIYEKLDDLELFRERINPRQYELQKKKLTEVLPEPQILPNMNLQPISDWVKQISFTEGEGKVGIIALFRDYLHSLPWEAFGGSSSWEIEGYINGSIVNTGDKIQNIEVRKRRRATGNSLFKRFLMEVLTPEQQSHLENMYNRTFNAYYRPDYRQVPILSSINANFNPKQKPGKHPLVVKEIQKEGAAFLATKGAGTLAYDVGVGKTLTAIIAINDVMKRGWAKKPLLVVPNGVYRNWINEISEVIPDVKINSLMNLGAAFKGDLKTLEIEDGTLSIITYEGLTRLGFKDETYKELTADLKDVMTGVNNTKRAAEKELAQVEQQVGRAIRGTTEDRYFEDLGFDHITIDEVHNFKNIFAGAKIERGNGNEYRNVRGSSSARGIKAYLMAQYVLKQNNNRNVFLLSATPFTNSPLEIYSIVSLMGKKRLEELGLKNVNDFMSMFMELKPTFVVKANQNVQEEDVIERFQNLQQLQKMVTEFIDFRTGEEAGVDRPGKIKRTITLSPTELQNNYIKQAQPLFNAKDKGGAIVAITELQNITLSPYLSRFNDHSPTYREFVDNSPKIKFAVEAVAQVHKDNKNVGQIIYMPRGVEHFDLVKEYLVKEKGFKPSQVAMITGGMNINVKQTIQNAFNAGTVKVLIGTEAIKEGVNLQEKTTDLYHLHLPWNPTDMVQVEGRLWRQGNEWANVRIHYPLIENSVDSFIFQKLETKEKRIKNLWSYKDNDIDVGDLDFENMKLDLITNPVIRVRAERTFETKKESQKLEQLKVELSFTERKIIKVKEAELEVQKAEQALANEPESAYWKQQKSRAKAALTNARRDLVAKGIDIPDLEKKSKELQTEITEQEKVIEGLDKKFEALLKEAEGKEEQLSSRPNNYAEHIAPIAEEDKTFFVKRKSSQKVSSSDYKSLGGTADVGGYADIESAEATVSNLKSVEFPELLRLVQEITGEIPTLKRFRRALGRFYSKGTGRIKLHPDIFKDPKLSLKVFAHEVGHLADYLPDHTLLRGNILGRIATLNKFLRGTFGEKEINNADIRAELKDLSQAWKPFDELENPNFTSYRYSSKELYADAISVLFNDPALLKEKAPTFFTAFFDELDAKEEFKTKFFELQDLLNEGEEAVFKARDEALTKAYAKAEDAWAAKLTEKQNRKGNFLHVLSVLFSNKNAPINAKVRQAIKEGKKVEDSVNPALQYAGLRYLDGKLKNFVADNFQPVYEKAGKVPDGWNLLGKILQLERAVNERGDLANPGGYDVKTAKDQLAAYEKFTPAEDWKQIQEAKEDFRKAVQAVVAMAEENKFYTPEMLEVMKANPAYATFQVIDYLDTYISSSIKKQVGTLKDVANPATSTVMKAIATMKAIEYNNAKISAVDFHREMFPDEIESAKTTFTGKGFRIMDPTNRDQDLVIVIRDGKAEGWYVDAGVGRVLNGTSTEVMAMAAKVSRIISGSPFYRPLFTSMNLGFQTFNFVRDFMRYWKNIPDRSFKDAITSFPRAGWRYVQAVPASFARATNKPNELIKQMENEKIIGLTYNDMFQSHDPGDAQIERVLERSGIMVREKTKSTIRQIVSPFVFALQKVEQVGNFIETLPKVAAYIELEGTMPKNELAEFIRTRVGSPDFRRGGELTPITNNLFLFSNAYIQGIKSDIQSATDPKTRGGYWWKTIVATVLPKMIMLGITLGLGGDWLKERFRDVSEYDKTNYTIIPIGVDENGKTVYWRLPQDETGRFLGGLLWKLGKTATKEQLQVADLFQVVDFGAGQVPNLAPGLIGAGAVLEYLSGRNPYDSFRGRFVVPEKIFNAGTEESLPYFLDWLAKQQGLGIIVPTFSPKGEITKLQEFLHAPILSNIAGRWLKVSDYGRTEEAYEISAQFDQAAAKKSLNKQKKVDEAIAEYQSGEQTDNRRKEIEKKLIEEVVGPGPYKGDTQAEATRLVTSFKKGLVKGRSDPDANSLIYANTNEEKMAQIKRIYGDMGDTQEFRDFINEMADYKVISNDLVKRVKSEILK